MAFGGSSEKLAPKSSVVEKDILFNPKAKVISEESKETRRRRFDAIPSAAERVQQKQF
jgi:hypothetical protein